MFRKYHCVRQADGSDCGAAALATIARHHRLRIGLQTLRELAGTDRVGTNLLGLVRAAERIGFNAQAVKGPYEALVGAPLPAIAHIKNEEGCGHFVVLHRAGRRGVLIADPGRGVRTLTREQFTHSWTGYLVLLAPDELRRPAVVAAPSSPSRRFWGLLRAQRGLLAEAAGCAVLMTLLGISTSYFVQHLVDTVLVRGETPLLNALGLGMAGIVLFRTLFAALRHYLLAHIGRRVDLSLIAGYVRHTLSLPLSFFEMRQVGEILSRVNDAGKVRQAIAGATLTAVVDALLVVFTTAVLWLYDPRLALLATLFAPLMLAVVLVHHPAVRRRSLEAMESGASLSAHVVEDVSGVETIKAFGAERSRTVGGEQRLVRLVQSLFGLQKLSISMSAAGGLVSGLAGVAVLWYGGHRVISGALTIGELMFFYTLLGHLLDPLQRLAALNLQIQDALVAVDRLFQVLDLASEWPAERRASFQGVRDRIQLRGVGFRYGCRGPVLEGLELTIPAGATVAIVGESGCGKSTLLKLLTRFHDPTEGQVLVDGVDLRDIDLASLRQRVAVVSQEPFVFSGTVRENIALGAPDVGFDEIIAAARAAGLEECIAALPERYDTLLGERGANLSGGQRQRLAIARALVRKPAVLVFDEATSHLDTATERAIQESLRGEFAQRTVLLVAHRLSTIREADLIYVMHQGRVVEQGDHDSLLALRGRYAQLWRSQSESARSSAGPLLPEGPATSGAPATSGLTTAPQPV